MSVCRRREPQKSTRRCWVSLDANAAYAYYAGDYRKSLSIIIGGSYTSHVPALGFASGELETSMKERANKVSREMYDTAMRASVQLEDSGWAGYLAAASRKYVSTRI
jgi:hypothetical protein